MHKVYTEYHSNFLKWNCLFRLPVDIYQTAKVSKLLLMMEKGKLPVEYKGKSLDEIEIDIESPKENHGKVKSHCPKKI